MRLNCDNKYNNNNNHNKRKTNIKVKSWKLNEKEFLVSFFSVFAGKNRKCNQYSYTYSVCHTRTHAAQNKCKKVYRSEMVRVFSFRFKVLHVGAKPQKQEKQNDKIKATTRKPVMHLSFFFLQSSRIVQWTKTLDRDQDFLHTVLDVGIYFSSPYDNKGR